MTQQAVLTAMLDQSSKGTCGSALYYDPKGQKPMGLEEQFRFLPAEKLGHQIQETQPDREGFACCWRPVRPIPDKDDFFESVWRTYRENGNVY